MKITEQEKRLRQDRIIYIAFRLFCAKGIERVSMEDVAKEAQVGNTTVYRYFINKSLLVKSTLSVLWKEITEKLKLEGAGTKNYENMSGIEQIRIQLNCMRSFYFEFKEYVLFSYEAKLFLVRNSVHISKEQYDFLMWDMREPCIQSIRKGKADGSIPTDEEEEALFYAMWGSVRGYIVKIVIYDSLCNGESLWEQKYDTMERGILSALSGGWKVAENIKE